MAPPPPRQPRLQAHPRSPAPELADELIEEILLRLPLCDAASLARATLVGKAWRRTASDVGFLRRYRDYHGTPPLVGYIRNTYDRPRLVPTSTAHRPPPFSMPRHASASSSTRFKRRPRWWALDCRHGRLLICHLIDGQSIRFIVWDPITGASKHLKAPAAHVLSSSCCTAAVIDAVDSCNHLPYAAAVLCAVDGCDHLRCHGGPFQVLLVGTHIVHQEHVAWATVYSSEAQEWGVASPSIVLNCPTFMVWTPSLLIGDVLYFTLHVPWPGAAIILKYDLLGSHGLSMVDTLALDRSAVLVEADDGGLGFVSVRGNCIYLMAQQAAGADGATEWVQRRAIDISTTLIPKYPHAVIGNVEGTDTVFVSTATGVFTLDLKSRAATKVSGETKTPWDILPYTTFYLHSRTTC